VQAVAICHNARRDAMEKMSVSRVDYFWTSRSEKCGNI